MIAACGFRAPVPQAVAGTDAVGSIDAFWPDGSRIEGLECALALSDADARRRGAGRIDEHDVMLQKGATMQAGHAVDGGYLFALIMGVVAFPT